MNNFELMKKFSYVYWIRRFVFRGNERLLHQAFNNLIINAMKYAPQNSMINITLTSTNLDYI